MKIRQELKRGKIITFNPLYSLRLEISVRRYGIIIWPKDRINCKLTNRENQKDLIASPIIIILSKSNVRNVKAIILAYSVNRIE